MAELNPDQFPEVKMTAAMKQKRQKGYTPTTRVEGEDTPRHVWTGHPSERPEGYLQAELPR